MPLSGCVAGKQPVVVDSAGLEITMATRFGRALLTGLALYFTFQPKEREAPVRHDEAGALSGTSIESVPSAV